MGCFSASQEQCERPLVLLSEPPVFVIVIVKTTCRIIIVMLMIMTKMSLTRSLNLARKLASLVRASSSFKQTRGSSPSSLNRSVSCHFFKILCVAPGRELASEFKTNSLGIGHMESLHYVPFKLVLIQAIWKNGRHKKDILLPVFQITKPLLSLKEERV